MNGYPARRTVFGGFSGADSQSRLLRVLHAARWVHAPSCHGLVRPPVVLGVAYVERPSRFEARDVQKRAKHAMFVDVDFVQAFSEPLACARGLIGNFVNAFQRLSAVVRELTFFFIVVVATEVAKLTVNSQSFSESRGAAVRGATLKDEPIQLGKRCILKRS